MSFVDDPTKHHWPKPWPERTFGQHTDRAILLKIAEHEQPLLLSHIQKLRQTKSHELIPGAIVGRSQFELMVNFTVLYRVSYLLEHGWPQVHGDILRDLIVQCAPYTDIIEINAPQSPE